MIAECQLEPENFAVLRDALLLKLLPGELRAPSSKEAENG